MNLNLLFFESCLMFNGRTHYTKYFLEYNVNLKILKPYQIKPNRNAKLKHQFFSQTTTKSNLFLKYPLGLRALIIHHIQFKRI